jgi:hypothetical protein
MQIDLAPAETRVPLHCGMNTSPQCRKQEWEGGHLGGVSFRTAASGETGMRGNEVGVRSGMIMDVDVSSSATNSGTSSDDGDDLFEEMSELRRRHRVFCLQLAQVNDTEARKRMMEVWNEVFSDAMFLEEVASEFDRKDAEEQMEFFDSCCRTRRVCVSAPHRSPSPLSYHF